MREKGIVFISLVFVVIVLSEVIYSFIKKKGTYNLKDTLSNLTQGVGQQTTGVFSISLMLFSYNYLYENFALFSIERFTALHWVILILLVDLIYYVAHRAAHRVNILVATHIVHHQADDYNYGSALRQSWTGRFGTFPFYLTLAFLGFPLKQLVIAQLGVMFVQFFAHNGTIRRKLGFLEYIFITPSTHRVHHGTNDKYIDMNCGGMLVIWDKLFGTFVEEDRTEPVKIGIRGKFNHFDPLEANSNYYKRILFVMKRRKGIFNKLSILFETPEQLSEDLARYGYIEKSILDKSQSLTTMEMVIALSLIVTSMTGQLYYVYEVHQMELYEKLLGAGLLMSLIIVVGMVISKKFVLPQFVKSILTTNLRS